PSFEVPCIPKVKPKATPQALRSRPERPFGPTFGTRHVSPNTPNRENPSGCRPSSPSVPECLNRKPPPEASECATCPARDLSPGRSPDATRVPSCRPPGYHRQRRESSPKDPPGTRRVRHVSRQPFFPTKLQKNQTKCLELLKSIEI